MFEKYLFVFFVSLFGDRLCLAQLSLQIGNPVVLHVGLVLQGLAYPTLTVK